MQVRYMIKQASCPEMGLGVFADQFIRQDSLIWRYDARQHMHFGISNKEQLERYLSIRPYGEAHQLMQYMTYINGKLVCEVGDGRYMNHSENANTYCVNVANSDIREIYAKYNIFNGQEIFHDYRSTYDPMMDVVFDFTNLERKYDVFVANYTKAMNNNNNNNNTHSNHNNHNKNNNNMNPMSTDSFIVSKL